MSRHSHLSSSGNLNIVVFALLAVATCAASADAALIAYWKLDPSSPLTDSSGNGHTLQAAPQTAPGVSTDGLPGAGSFTYSNPNFHAGTAASSTFDGSDALITSGALGLNAYNQLTIEWFQAITSGGSANTYFSGNPTDSNGDPTAAGHTGDFSFQSTGTFRDFGGGNVDPSVATDGVWHEFAITLNSTTGAAQLYEDYNPINSNPSAVVPFANVDFVLGKDYYPAAGRFLVGSLANVSISSGILTPDQFVSAQVVPEPSSVFILGLGTIGLLAVVRRRRARWTAEERATAGV